MERKIFIKNFIVGILSVIVCFVTFFGFVSSVHAEDINDSWLSKSYERIEMFEFGAFSQSDFDYNNYKNTYSEIVKSSGSSYKVVFNTESINYYVSSDASENIIIYSRFDGDDYLTIYYDFSTVDIINIVYYTGHDVSDCSSVTHGISDGKLLSIHVLDKFKSEGTASLLLGNIFPEPVCIDNVQLLQENVGGNFTPEKSGEVYYSDILKRYEFYSYEGFNVGESQNSASGDSGSSSGGGLVTPPSDSDFSDPLEYNFFDGSVDSVIPESKGTKNYLDILNIEWDGISGGAATIDKTYVEYPDLCRKGYELVWRSGGKSNSSRFIKFNVSEKVSYFQVYVVIAPNGTSTADISLGGQQLFNTGSDKDTYTCALSDVMAPGDYELMFTNSIRIADITFYLTLKAEVPEAPLPDDILVPSDGNTVAFHYVDDNGIQRHFYISRKHWSEFKSLPLPPDVVKGEFLGWYEDNGVYENEFTFSEFQQYFFDITYEVDGVITPTKHIFAKIMDKDGKIESNDEILEKGENVKPSEEPTDSKAEVLCKHEIDWLKFACKKCGMSVFAIIWNAIKYWVLGILCVILAVIMVKWAVKLIKG